MSILRPRRRGDRRAERAATRARRPKVGQRTARCHRHVDEVAVYRAVRGERLRLGVEERRLAVAELTRQGRSINWIAAQLGVSHMTVTRHRRSAAA